MLLPVRLQDSISSDRYHPGDTFIAVLDQPLVIDGLVIAEKGARVEGKIVASERAGRVKGLASVALELTRLNLSDGQHIEISTDTFTKMGPESKGTDAAKIGGGAALGADHRSYRRRRKGRGDWSRRGWRGGNRHCDGNTRQAGGAAERNQNQFPIE